MITSFGILKKKKNDVCRMTLNEAMPRKSRKIEENKGGENFWNVCEKEQNMITCDHSVFSDADNGQWYLISYNYVYS